LSEHCFVGSTLERLFLKPQTLITPIPSVFIAEEIGWMMAIEAIPVEVAATLTGSNTKND
jgi:hypothetical protein